MSYCLFNLLVKIRCYIVYIFFALQQFLNEPKKYKLLIQLTITLRKRNKSDTPNHKQWKHHHAKLEQEQKFINIPCIFT